MLEGLLLKKDSWHADVQYEDPSLIDWLHNRVHTGGWDWAQVWHYHED